MKRYGLAFLTLVLLCGPLAAGEACQQQAVASAPLQKARLFNQVATPVTISGQPLRFLVDTGSPSSMVTEHAAEAAGLKPKALTSGSVKMFGGDEAKSSVHVTNFKIGNAAMPDADFAVMRTLRFNFGGEQFDGLIGADILARYDADFDFAAGTLTLFQPHPCDGHEIQWKTATAIETLPFTGDNGRIIVPITLDGRDMIAIVDTGASDSSLGAKIGMAKLALSPQSPGMVREGPAADADPIYDYTFREMKLGSVMLTDTRFRFIPFSKAHWFFAGLVGMPELRRLHLYIAYKEHKLYLTPASAP
ncbi:MAG: aspartyl protease family protein [Rhizomicrobium sp.]